MDDHCSNDFVLRDDINWDEYVGLDMMQATEAIGDKAGSIFGSDLPGASLSAFPADLSTQSGEDPSVDYQQFAMGIDPSTFRKRQIVPNAVDQRATPVGRIGQHGGTAAAEGMLKRSPQAHDDGRFNAISAVPNGVESRKTDDDDMSGEGSIADYSPRKHSHLLSEKRRRVQMRECFNRLCEVLPVNQSRRPSKASLLQAALVYISNAQRQEAFLKGRLNMLHQGNIMLQAQLNEMKAAMSSAVQSTWLASGSEMPAEIARAKH